MRGPMVSKLYLSAILDLGDRRIVSYAIRDTNDTVLVLRTLDWALDANPGAPLCSTAAGAVPIPRESSTISWPWPVSLRACPGLESA